VIRFLRKVLPRVNGPRCESENLFILYLCTHIRRKKSSVFVSSVGFEALDVDRLCRNVSLLCNGALLCMILSEESMVVGTDAKQRLVKAFETHHVLAVQTVSPPSRALFQELGQVAPGITTGLHLYPKR
jgi:hypothetical protein